jgi:thiamine pyrophosphate-dependent acetolactate synthase large subunit-like protein
MNSKLNISEKIINKIIEVNGKGSYIFGICGSTWYYVDKAIQDNINKGLIKYFHSSNESSGINLAAYHASIINKIGVHFCTGGPGAAMAVSAVANIFNEAKPCVIFIGIPTNTYFEYFDPNIMRPISTAVFFIKDVNSNVNLILDEAFKIAKCGTIVNPREGPVVVFVNEALWLLDSKYDSVYVNNRCLYKCEQDNNKINKMLYKIQQTINSNTKVIIRVGHNVSIENIKQLANLTNDYKNFYLQLTYHSKKNFNAVDNKYPNVGIEGNLGDPIVNNNYSVTDVVIQFGLDFNQIYYLFEFQDVSVYTRPNTPIWYIINGIEQFLPSYITKDNSISTKCDYFIEKWLKQVYTTYQKPSKSAIWIPIKEKNNYWEQIVNKYILQNQEGILTTASVISQVLKTIYELQKNNEVYVIEDNLLYASDLGTSSFIFTQLTNHSKPNHFLSYYDFCPIGVGFAGAAGYLLSNKYTDLVFIMGDGGFTNSPGYFMDLINTIAKFPSMRCLLLFMNDKSYTNVKIEEIDTFGYSTSLSSTAPNQQNIDYYNLLKAFSGNLFVSSLIISDLKEPSKELSTYVKKWYKKEFGFTKGGIYIINYNTTKGTPYFYLSDGSEIPK